MKFVVHVGNNICIPEILYYHAEEQNMTKAV